jgi:nucleoid-associated protein YgaU
MFSPNGVPLRATVNVKLREYKALDEQLVQLGLNSPDKTQVRILGADETLSSIAAEHYLDPKHWRLIADENGIEDPRRLTAGAYLRLPPLS